jgi:superfamily I DNA/RNA helicase
LAELFDAIVEQTGYRESLKATEDDLERWANLLELRADLERYDSVDPAEAMTCLPGTGLAHRRCRLDERRATRSGHVDHVAFGQGA